MTDNRANHRHKWGVPTRDPYYPKQSYYADQEREAQERRQYNNGRHRNEAGPQDGVENCRAASVHVSEAYTVVCQLAKGHTGEHRDEDGKWNDAACLEQRAE